MRLKILAASFALAAAIAIVLMAAPQVPTGQERTLTGCVRAGSAASVFLLRNASDVVEAMPAKAGALPEDFVLIGIPDQLNLSDHLNHRVSITGAIVDPKAGPPPAGTNAAERALRRLTVKTLKMLASNCAQP